ncbi:MAG: NAD(P)-dependent oxidoreductase [Planctomycetes bacterium]|nr:NAD(P)-dependent oxidoreductase [Planctomycetota bacterium]
MNILLTGFSGTLGTAVTKSLLESGHHLHVLLHGAAINHQELNPDVEIVWGSLSHHHLFDQITNGIDVVVHCAWESRGMFNGMLEKMNLDGTINLIKSAERNQVKTFIHISSVGVYGLARSLWGKVLDEDCPLVSKEESLNPYPWVKVLIENKCEQLKGKLDMNLIIIRPGLLFSDEKAPGKKLISFRSKKFAIIVGRGKNHLPYIHVDDVAEMVTLLIENPRKYAVYNCAPTNHVCIAECVKKWGEHTGHPVTILRLSPVVFRLMSWFVRKLKSILGRKSKGHSTTYQIHTGIRDIRYSSEKATRELCWKDTHTNIIFS